MKPITVYVGLTLVVLCVAVSRAEAQLALSVGRVVAFEKGTNGRSTEARQELALRAGYRTSIADLTLETTSFDESDGSSVVRVEREHREWVAWASRALYEAGIINNEIKLRPYLGLGAGVQYDRVVTTFAAERKTSTSQPLGLMAIAGGVKAAVYRGLELDLEARLTSSSGYFPNPLPAIGLFAGWRF